MSIISSLGWLLQVRLLFLLELHPALTFLGSSDGINFGISELVLHKRLAFETLAALQVLLTFLLGKALHELVHQLSWVEVCFRFLPPTAIAGSVVAAFLGGLS